MTNGAETMLSALILSDLLAIINEGHRVAILFPKAPSMPSVAVDGCKPNCLEVGASQTPKYWLTIERTISGKLRLGGCRRWALRRLITGLSNRTKTGWRLVFGRPLFLILSIDTLINLL